MSKRIQWRKILGLKSTRRLYADKTDSGHRIKIVGTATAAEIEGFRQKLEAEGIRVYSALNAVSRGSAYGMSYTYDVVLIQVGKKSELHRCSSCGAQAMTPTGQMWLDHLRPDGRRCLKSLDLRGVYIHPSRARAGYAPYR